MSLSAGRFRGKMFKYFLTNVPHLNLLRVLTMIDHDQFYEEFIDYQALRDNDFPVESFDDANAIEGRVDEEEVYHYRIDTMWFHINKMQIAGTKIKHLKLLPKVAEVVLVMLSNAQCTVMLT